MRTESKFAIIDSPAKPDCRAPRIAIEANSISAIVELVRRGQLATILPAAIALEQPGLLALALTPELPQRTVALLSRRGAWRSAACQAFATLAGQWRNV